jgi:hypothetical protein
VFRHPAELCGHDDLWDPPVRALIVAVAQDLLPVLALAAALVWVTRDRAGKVTLVGQAAVGLFLVGLPAALAQEQVRARVGPRGSTGWAGMLSAVTSSADLERPSGGHNHASPGCARRP